MDLEQRLRRHAGGLLGSGAPKQEQHNSTAQQPKRRRQTGSPIGPNFQSASDQQHHQLQNQQQEQTQTQPQQQQQQQQRQEQQQEEKRKRLKKHKVHLPSLARMQQKESNPRSGSQWLENGEGMRDMPSAPDRAQEIRFPDGQVPSQRGKKRKRRGRGISGREGLTGAGEGVQKVGAGRREEKKKEKKVRIKGARAHGEAADFSSSRSKAEQASSRSKAQKTGNRQGCAALSPGSGSAVGKAETEQLASAAASRPSVGSSLLHKMRARLFGGHFRMLNEKLYTCRGSEAFQLFSKDEDAFKQYHEGFREQVSKWPVNPLHVIVDWLKTNQPPTSIVVDFGCGEAKLAASVRQKVHSLDLVATAPGVIACNMAQTPLETACADVAVFCLSLMGVDYPLFLAEASRVLRPNGWLVIAEVRSRFDSENGGADFDTFCSCLRGIGFRLHSLDDSNKMFLLAFFRKQQPPKKPQKNRAQVSPGDWPELKPCLYKRR